MSKFTNVLNKAKDGRKEISARYQIALNKKALETEEIKKTLDKKFKTKGSDQSLIDHRICLKKLNKEFNRLVKSGVYKQDIAKAIKADQSYFRQVLKGKHQMTVKFSDSIIRFFGQAVVRDDFDPVVHKPTRWVNPRFNTDIDHEKLVNRLQDLVASEGTSLRALAIKHGFSHTKYNHIISDKSLGFTQKTARALITKLGKSILKDGK